MDFNAKIPLGRTGIMVGKLGIASSYGATAEVYEEAFERGCNYFTWGSFIKGRSRELKKAVKNIIAKGQRENLVLAFLNYSHSRYFTRKSVYNGLKALGTDYADVLLFGWYPRRPPNELIAMGLGLQCSGIVKAVGLTSHNRKLFPLLAEEGLFDVFHIRYNAANSGAEQDVFPYLNISERPAVVSFTATRWGQLLKQSRMPDGYEAPKARDCYRFVLSNPSVDVCMMGVRNINQLRENLETLDMGPLSEDEMNRIRTIGDFVYGRKK